MKSWSNCLAVVSLVSLLFLCLVWELWLAPLHSGGSTLSFKALPLLLPLFGILHGKRYTHQWASMLALAYVAEGVVRATTDTGTNQALAATEIILAVLLFVGCVTYTRISAPSRLVKSVD